MASITLPPKGALKDFAALAKALDVFRSLDAEMPMQMAQTFLAVCIQPGLTMKDLADRVGISQSSCSRNIAALSEWHRLGREGHNLVIATEDPSERRRKIINLTTRGKRIAEQLARAIG